MATPMSNASAACPLCSDTGWRADETGAGVVPCECRTRGIVKLTHHELRQPQYMGS